MSVGLANGLPEGVQTVDVVFRPDAGAARESVDLEYWDGEVVVKGVTVVWPLPGPGGQDR